MPPVTGTFGLPELAFIAMRETAAYGGETRTGSAVPAWKTDRHSFNEKRRNRN
jgi:hypothetical protein